MNPPLDNLADDPELAELLAEFVGDLPRRIRLMQRAYGASDWEELEGYCHQLKGVAGGFGYDEITSVAGRTERTIREHRSEAEIEEVLGHLFELCRRAEAERDASGS